MKKHIIVTIAAAAFLITGCTNCPPTGFGANSGSYEQVPLEKFFHYGNHYSGKYVEITDAYLTKWETDAETPGKIIVGLSCEPDRGYVASVTVDASLYDQVHGYAENYQKVTIRALGTGFTGPRASAKAIEIYPAP